MQGIPRAGFHTLTPRIFSARAPALIAFLREVFGARGEECPDRPCELRIGDSLVMVTGTEARAAFAAFLYVYVDDADRVYTRALAAGATALEPPFDTPYGDRRAMLADPFGNIWQVAHVLPEQRAASCKAVAFLATSKPGEARRFFGDVLGLRLVEEHEFAIVFDAHGTMLRVQKVAQVAVAPYTSFGLEVADIEATVDALGAHGVRGKRYPHFEQDARGIWSAPGGARVFWFEDPDGNLLSLQSAAG
jgi:PhnB protein